MSNTKTYKPLFSNLPEARSERWDRIKRFIATWYRPLIEGDGFPDAELAAREEALGFRIPAALREWYSLSGKRKDVWCRQDTLLDLQTILEYRGKIAPYYTKFKKDLVFYAENQQCEFWAIKQNELALPDPPVWRITDDPRPVCSTVSEFAIQTILRESIWTGTHSAHGEFEPDALKEAIASLSQQFTRCEISDTYREAMDPVHFYEGIDALFVTHEGTWLHFTALNEKACEQLPSAICNKLEWNARKH